MQHPAHKENRHPPQWVPVVCLQKSLFAAFLVALGDVRAVSKLLRLYREHALDAEFLRRNALRSSDRRDHREI